jgi:hypothetical protein
MIIDLQATDSDVDQLDLGKAARKADGIILYHGTSDVFKDQILANGILPREKTGNSTYSERPWAGESFPNLVYIGSLRRAYDLTGPALCKYDGSSIIFRFLISKKKSLVSDEDCKVKTGIESLVIGSTCASNLPILPSTFLGYLEKDSNRKWNYIELNPLPKINQTFYGDKKWSKFSGYPILEN